MAVAVVGFGGLLSVSTLLFRDAIFGIMSTRCPALSKAGTLSIKPQSTITRNSAPWRRHFSRIRRECALSKTLGSCTVRPFSSSQRPAASKADERRNAEDRQDIMVSVLQASATRRDAKNYLRKYAPQISSSRDSRKKPEDTSLPAFTWTAESSVRAASEAPLFIQGDRPEPTSVPDKPLNLAIVKLRLPQELVDETLRGIGKTLSQLRKLGLLSVVVLDAGPTQSRSLYRQEAYRLQQAFEDHDSPGARIADQSFTEKLAWDAGYMPSSVVVQSPDILTRALQDDEVLIIPPVTLSHDLDFAEIIDADEAIMALAKYFCGLQFANTENNDEMQTPVSGASTATASIERLIILDPHGATPIAGRLGPCHRFINLEQESDAILKSLMASSTEELGANDARPVHAKNLKLAKNVLSMLPSTSTALISTPFAAAAKPIESLTSVTTRNRLNPLIHNLLTDKPVFSSSLPVKRIRPDKPDETQPDRAHIATMVKRGMPLTIYPDPTRTRWLPPEPGAPRLRLTDTCIDLPRLQHLIEDSFNRKLDLQDYLNRVNDNLAGVIIAGEYEGGAVLTWEKPHGLSDKEAYESGRLVPYLDKFAVLKSCQGSGGVADVVFNAMVRGCFPDGVCWRSRKDNPVNKWYFERSSGTCKLKDTNWTMFWTTPHVSLGDAQFQDYEDVCRWVEPSWADKQLAAD